MDFFEQQDIARRKTGRLVLFFALAVVGIIAAIYLVIVLMLGASSSDADGGATVHRAPSLWQPELLLFVSVCTSVVIAIGSLVKIVELSSGGETVALMMGGRLLQKPTGDPGEQRLLNVVEEMSLASGLPVPPVYVLDKETSINAFAAGLRTDNAVVAVSRGCLEYLTRDELQGVVGHEFSHILNGDMRLNIKLIGVLNGILFLAILGYYILRIGGSVSSDNDKKGGGVPLALLGLALLVIGYIGVFFANIIKSSVSRQREYLADASSVQFTRNPSGIGGALRKIGGLSEGSRIKDHHAHEISHMFFGDALAGSLFNLFATHPPLEDRIKRVDPSFDGSFPEVAPEDQTRQSGAAAQVEQKRRETFGSILAPGAPQRAAGRAVTDKEKAQKAAMAGFSNMLGRMGMPGVGQMIAAGAMLQDMPENLSDAAHEPYGARCLVYAILFDRGDEVRQKQMRIIQSHSDELTYKLTEKLTAQVDKLADEARLPLVNLSIPALKKLSTGQYKDFRGAVQSLIEADSRVNLFEYSVRTMLLENLDVYFKLIKPAQAKYASLSPLRDQLKIALSTLAYAGEEQAGDAQRAFAAAVKDIASDMTPAQPGECSLGAFDKAMHELAQSAPQVKKQIVAAAAACIAADGKVSVKEAELMRAIAAILGCPVPPLLPEMAETEQ
jgi:Zn-dependent protease with chaperone function